MSTEDMHYCECQTCKQLRAQIEQLRAAETSDVPQKRGASHSPQVREATRPTEIDCNFFGVKRLPNCMAGCHWPKCEKPAASIGHHGGTD